MRTSSGEAPQWRPMLAYMVLALVATGCGASTWEPTLHRAAAAVPSAARDDGELKVHMSSGELYVLSTWVVPEPGGDISGFGVLFDADRVPGPAGAQNVPAAEIALLETNRREVVGRFGMSGLSVFSTVSALATLACVADPKSCFGSCPTFYGPDDPDRPLAEGFSSSFARSLEERDIDWLGLRARPGPVSLVMRNEAQETHAVRHVKLLAVPATEDGQVLLTGAGELLTAGEVRPPIRCAASGGDCLAEVVARDDREYAPRADSADLAAREEVVLDLGPVSGDAGLVISARNSFVTTYVFYQSLAYAGRRAGEVLAALERGEPGAKDRVLGVARELGGIEVFVGDDRGSWEHVGAFDEAGPIAADRQIVPLGTVESRNLRVMLRMARGNWRVDELGLAVLTGSAPALLIEPDSVTSAAPVGRRAFHALTDPERHLVTVPGDEYRIWFTVPEGADHELFLDSRGYYYEWMRDGWLRDESLERVASVMLSPREALKAMAPGFKAIEPDMERLFWASRFRR